jgi:hypothetical protein
MFDDVSNTDIRDQMWIEFTTHKVADAYGFTDTTGEVDTGEFIFQMNKTAITNFWQAKLEDENFFDGKWHYFVIQSDGTNITFYIDGVDRTADMTTSTGGTGVDETTWWNDYTGWDFIGVNRSANWVTSDSEFMMAHLALHDRTLSATEVSDAWESLPQTTVVQPSAGTSSWKTSLNLADPFQLMMVQSHPSVWIRMNETSGNLIGNTGYHGTMTKGIIQDPANVTMNLAGPGAAGERSIEFAHSASNGFAGVSWDIFQSRGPSINDDVGAVMAWIYIDELSHGTNCPIMSVYPQIPSWEFLNFYIDSSGHVNFWLEDPGSGTQTTHIVSTNAISLQAWHCIIVTQDANANWRLYIDGSEDTTYTYATASTSEFYWWDESVWSSPWSTIGFQLQNKSDGTAPVAGNVYDTEQTFRLSNLALWFDPTNDSTRGALSKLSRAPINPAALWDAGRGV